MGVQSFVEILGSRIAGDGLYSDLVERLMQSQDFFLELRARFHYVSIADQMSLSNGLSWFDLFNWRFCQHMSRGEQDAQYQPRYPHTTAGQGAQLRDSAQVT